jgi:hypothetical protein
MCDDLAWMMLANCMCTFGKILSPILRGEGRMAIVEPSEVTYFYHNKIVNGRPCIEL